MNTKRKQQLDRFLDEFMEKEYKGRDHAVAREHYRKLFHELIPKYFSDTESDEGKNAMEDVKQLDVRQIPPPQKHPAIFKTFDSLEKGESFILINDHEPRPLYYQFEAERSGQFQWDYLEQGPDVWRVNIMKV